jgi:oxygen-independent coproporphyrinogen-3 oxidase
MCQSIAAELLLRKQYLAHQSIETIYFGGGTPSVLTQSHLDLILNSVYKNYLVSEKPEITLECNPDDLSDEKIRIFSTTGINRLSIGIQSFRAPDLAYLSRHHTPEQIAIGIETARNAGFENLSIDLIYGVPTLGIKDWEYNLQKAFELGIPHISAYSLTVEHKTALDHYIRQNKVKAPTEEQAVEHYHILTQLMRDNGYLHYEISNFCLPGYFSKHNTSYWSGKPYLGVGPSAHSFDGKSRCWNVSHIQLYMDGINHQLPVIESEVLSTTMKVNEYLMTSLRTMWGCDLSYISAQFGNNISKIILDKVMHSPDNHYFETNENTIKLTADGKLMADGLTAGLFFDEDIP